ncbi:MAG: acyl-CoA thioesterase-1 [bacterium]|jgi:acyl-CoA thioesterase-1
MKAKIGSLFLLLTLCFITPTYAKQPIKVLFLGDSLTEGYGVEKSQSYPSLVYQKLKERGYTHVKVINAGISGSTTASAPHRIRWYLRGKPNILILALGGNDGLRGISPESMKKNLTKTIKLAQSQGIKVVLAGMQIPPNYGPDYTKKFKKVFPDLAKQYSTSLIPFLLEGVAGDPNLNLPDGIHPNQKGHQILAKTVLKNLLPLL